MNITVYLGSSPGASPAYERAVTALGTWIGQAGHNLIYGGSKVGLMGMLASAVLAAGGEVTGVEPEFFVRSALQHEGITRLIVTRDMSERKAKMIALGDAFIAFPGGSGTLEEISEIISHINIGLMKAPCIVYNLNHFYDCLKGQLDVMVQEGFMTEENRRNVIFVSTLEEAARALSGLPGDRGDL